jgi:hypothetical protein
MPVYKYRDVAEMEERGWRPKGDHGLFRAIRACWELARRTTAPHFPPGVYRHRSAEEAAALRERWERANFEAFHAMRRARARERAGDAQGS